MIAPFLFPFIVVAQSSKFDVTWQDPVGWERVATHLSGTWVNGEKGSQLHLHFIQSDVESDFVLNQKWGEMENAAPIRVAESESPQVLVRSRRPNWMDYRIYAASTDDCTCLFSVSVRDSLAIRWEGDAKGLRSFTLFDRWMPATRKEPRGMRWEQISHYRFRKGHWVKTSSRWATYKFGTSPGGNEWPKGNYPFRWRP